METCKIPQGRFSNVSSTWIWMLSGNIGKVSRKAIEFSSNVEQQGLKDEENEGVKNKERTIGANITKKQKEAKKSLRVTLVKFYEVSQRGKCSSSGEIFLNEESFYEYLTSLKLFFSFPIRTFSLILLRHYCKTPNSQPVGRDSTLHGRKASRHVRKPSSMISLYKYKTVKFPCLVLLLFIPNVICISKKIQGCTWFEFARNVLST